MAISPKKDDHKGELSREETDRRRDATIRNLLKTPPKPRKGKDGAKKDQKSKES